METNWIDELEKLWTDRLVRFEKLHKGALNEGTEEDVINFGAKAAELRECLNEFKSKKA